MENAIVVVSKIIMIILFAIIATILVVVSVSIPIGVVWGIWLLIGGSPWHVALIPPAIAISVSIVAAILATIALFIKGALD